MSDKSAIDLFRGLLSDIQDDDATALQLGLQPPVMAQQQVPQVQIPMAPPVPQQPIPGIEMAPPPIDVGQIAIAQPLVGSMVNRGSARAGLDGRQAQFEADQRSKDFGVIGGPYNYLIPGEETLKGFPTEPGRNTTYADLIGKPYDYETALGLNNPLYVPPTGGYTPKPTEEEPSFFDNMRAPRPSYLISGFEEDVSSQETLDKTYEFANWVKDNPVEAAAAGVSLYPAARVGGAVVKGASHVVGKLSNFTRGKLPKRFRDFFGNTKTVQGKSTTTKVQREGQPGVYDPVRTTKEVFTVSPTKTGITAAGLYAGSETGEALFPDIPEPEGSGIPKAEQELLDGEPAVDLTPIQPAVTPTQTVEEEVEARAGGVGTINPEDLTVAGDALDPTLKKKIDTAIKKTTGDEILEEEDEEEKEGFLKNLWGGVKDFFKEGFEDPMLRKTLLAYVLSKSVGADGVTAAGMVLEAEYKKDLAKTAREAASAEKQLDREYDLLQTMSKEQRAAYKKQQEDNKIDYTQSRTLYDKRTNKNYTGSVSPSGLIEIDDPSFYEGATMPDPNDPTKSIPIPAGTPLSMAALRQSGMYTLGEGKTSTELNTEMTGRMTEYFETGVAQRLAEATASGADSTAVAALDKLIRTKATPQNLEQAAMVYRSFYPTGTDFSSTEAKSVFNNGFDKWMTSITEGREGNAKSLAAFLEREHIKYNDQNKLSESFFEANGEPIGAESWIKTSGKVKNLHGYLNRGRAGGNSEVTKPAVWNFLERAYLKQSDQMGDGFKDFWETESKKSAKNKAQAASPAMLWIQSIDRNKSTTGSKYFAGSMKDIIANMKN
ncbi:hypothetical protein N9095_00495 [bacterium]|nr:hypothetical protein [bacterium]